MTEEERRAKARRKYARRRARMLGLPIPEFAVSTGGRPRLAEEQHLAPVEFLERQRERQIERMRQRRRMMGVRSREEKREARERADAERRLAREAEREARRETARERRLEQYRINAKRYRALYPEKKRAQDRHWRAENKEKDQAANRARKLKAWERGYRWKPTEQSIKRQREYARLENIATTAAHRYLVSVGLTPWFGPRETTVARRRAAFLYAREHGLLP